MPRRDCAAAGALAAMEGPPGGAWAHGAWAAAHPGGSGARGALWAGSVPACSPAATGGAAGAGPCVTGSRPGGAGTLACSTLAPPGSWACAARELLAHGTAWLMASTAHATSARDVTAEVINAASSGSSSGGCSISSSGAGARVGSVGRALLPLAAVSVQGPAGQPSKQEARQQQLEAKQAVDAEEARAKEAARARSKAGRDKLQVDLSGTWIKDRERSHSMEDAMNLMHLNGLVRQAVKLVKGVRISQEEETFTFTVFSFIGWFKVKEVYPWSGEPKLFRRRDLRRGRATGWVEPSGQELRVQLRWQDPFGGHGSDLFRLVAEDELHIDSVLHVAGQSARYVTIYKRKADRAHPRAAGRGEHGEEHHSELHSEEHGHGAGQDRQHGGTGGKGR